MGMPGFVIGMGILMLAFWLLILAGIGFLIWFIVASLRPGQPVPPRIFGETPAEILKRRYASGEITTDQYEDMKRTLEEPP